jgi:site-specific recombinase XerD
MKEIPAEFEKALKEYQEIYLASRNLSVNTRREYTTDISQLLVFLASKGISEPQSIGLIDLEAFLAELDKRCLTGTTRRRKTSSIKSFFGFLEQDEYVKRDISKRLIPPRREYRNPRVLTQSEYQRLQLAVANEPRDAAIIELLLQTGIRLSELARLTIGDIELPVKLTKDGNGVGSLIIQEGKGRKGRILALNHKACKALKSWLKIRPEIQAGALFVSKFRRQISQGGYQWLIKKYLKEAGITNAHVHTLRHTFGTHMVKNGANLRTVQEMLGHNDLKTTSIYVSLAREQMNKDVQNFAL